MRILYDHQAFSLQNLGGITVYYYELASRLSLMPGVRVDVALGFNRCHYPFPKRARQNLNVFGWKTKMAVGFKRYAINEAVTGAWCLTQKKWDIYHSTLYRKMPTVAARRTVATNHDCTQDRFPELFKNPQRITNAKRELYARADAIFCVSEFSRKDLLKYYDVEPEKTHVIHQGFPRLERLPDQAGIFIEKIRRPYILFVGPRYAYKNFNGLLEAFGSGKLSRNYDLTVLGGEPFNEAEQKEINRLGLSSCVMHLRSVTDPILAEAYARAALFVSPSLYEGFGLPPLEALSLGCPVLASSTASIPEICGDAVLYFDPFAPGDLQRKIEDALNATDHAERLAKASERIQRYSWQTNAEKTFKVYEGLVR